jgi:hypothetical protein
LYRICVVLLNISGYDVVHRKVGEMKEEVKNNWTQDYASVTGASSTC